MQYKDFPVSEETIQNAITVGKEIYAAQFSCTPDQAFDQLKDILGERMAIDAILSTGSAWNDGVFTPRERSIATITALAAQGGLDRRLRSHIVLGKKNGLSNEELESLVRTISPYIGFGKGSIAMETVREFIEGDI